MIVQDLVIPASIVKSEWLAERCIQTSLGHVEIYLKAIDYTGIFEAPPWRVAERSIPKGTLALIEVEGQSFSRSVIEDLSQPFYTTG
ncbi:MAG TPA: hypothetical protein VME69_00025 [Methylocella sp.]|nr:hypothetical protein [Methylocella sp.]